MKPFTKHTGKVVALDRANVDTDQIIPKQFLKRIERTGFGEFLFWDWARRDDGSPASTLPLFTNFRSGARILAAADTVIAPLPPEQRPADKRLTPWPANGEGDVEVVLFPDEVSEAAAIADRIVELHAAGEAWRECAVLCRTSRLFPSLQLAMVERGVPVEIVGLAGLLQMPEIVEVLAYARIAADPEASVALARILLGPRYRIGPRDMARLAAWAKGRNTRPRVQSKPSALRLGTG